MKYLITLFIICIVGCYGETVYPATPLSEAPLFVQYMKGEGATLEAYARSNDEASGFSYKGEYQPLDTSIYVLETVTIDKQKAFPSSGFWVCRYEVCRDHANQIFNVGFLGQEDKAPIVVPLLNGTTHASLLLQMDTLPSVLITARLRLDTAPGVEVSVTDTKVVKEPYTRYEKGKTAEGVWEEEWKVRVGKSFTLMHITFTPDGQGGTYFSVDR